MEGHGYTQTGADTAFYVFQTLPQFPGGDSRLFDYIRTHTKMPLFGHPDNAISGYVVAKFTVPPEGTITDITLLKSLSRFHDNAVRQVLTEMPR